MRTRRDVPFPAEWTVEQGLTAYLAENGFTTESYDAKWTEASALGFKFKVPNTARHRLGIMFHDLHHVVTGFGTDHVGEGEISAWEMGRGPRALGLYVGGIVFSGALFGLLIAPRRTLAAWRQRGSGRSLFARGEMTDAQYRALLGLRIGALRERLGVPRDGVSSQPRALHAFAPSA